MAISITGTKFRAWSSADGSPLAFGKVFTYRSGTNIPKVTYTTEGQETENPNPVILNAAGYADIYLDGSYKIVVKDANDVEVHTTDPVSDPSQQGKEWINTIAASKFDSNKVVIEGNQTGVFQVGRRIRLDGTTFLYGDITEVIYNGSDQTIVTVLLDSGFISSSLSQVSVGILSSVAPSYPEFNFINNIKSDDGASHIKYNAAQSVKDKLDDVADREVVQNDISSAIDTHNLDAAAHPALSAFITSEADRAETAADAASLSRGIFATTAEGVGYGVIGHGAITGGSGGTNGQFDLAFSGGTGSGAAGRFVVAGGAVTEIFITAPGSYSVAPSFDFSASSGLTGASATCVIGRNADVGEYFSVPLSSDPNLLILYRVDSGNVAAEVGRYPSSVKITELDALIDSSRKRSDEALLESGSLFNPIDDDVAVGFFVNWTTGVLAANAIYSTSGFIPVSASTDYYSNEGVFIAFYDASKVFISGSSSAFGTIESPVGAAFCRFSYSSAINPNDVYFVEGDSPSADFPFYGGIINNDRVIDLNSSSIESNGITSKSCDFMTEGKNLFDRDAAAIGFFAGSIGDVIVDAQYFLSDFIEVEPGKTYHCKSATQSMRFLTAYNKFKLVVRAGGSDSTITEYTAPSDVKYVRFTGFVGTIGTYQFEKGASQSPYESYQRDKIKQSVSIEPLLGPFLEKTKNLFNKNAVTDDAFSGSNGTIQIGVSTTYSLSDYIEVEPGETYTYSSGGSDMRFYTAYDEDKIVVPAEGSDVGTSQITVPSSGVKYYRISVYKVDKDTAMLEKGASSTDYVAFGAQINSLVQLPSSNDFDRQNWQGKVAASYGDSITFQNRWQPYISQVLGITHTAYGVGGRQVGGAGGMNADSEIADLPVSVDLLMVLGGTNDWAQSRALGTIDSTNINEFYGAYNSMVQKLVTKYPLARIVLMATTYGELPQRVSPEGVWSTDDTNTQGLTTRDYAEAVKNIGMRWGLPVADTDQCGINALNNENYMIDDGGWLHPNDVGGAKIAEVVIGKLRSITPES